MEKVRESVADGISFERPRKSPADPKRLDSPCVSGHSSAPGATRHPQW